MDFFQNYVRFEKEVLLKISTQQVPVNHNAHPILMTIHGWSIVFLSIIVLYAVGYSLTRYKRQGDQPSPLAKGSHPAG